MNTATAPEMASCVILRLNTAGAFSRLNTEIMVKNRIATVVIFMPPAVEPGAPPISIRIIVITMPVPEKVL